MSKKTSWLLLIAILVISAAVVISCKKATTSAVVNTVDNTSETNAKTQSSDASFVTSETDQADNDVNNTASACARVNKNGPVATSNGVPSNADTSSTFAGVITINYHGQIGTTCRTRTGSITIQLMSGNKWSDSGAVLQYTFNNYKVTNNCNGKTVTLNGTRTITNLTGGNVYTITLAGNSSTIVHKVRANYTAAFTDSASTTVKTAVWNVARKTTISYLVGLYSISTAGDTTYNGIANTESWGTTRNGDAYTTVFTLPVTNNTYCGLPYIGRPTSGTVEYTVGSLAFNVQYGLTASGTPAAVGSCIPVYYYQVTCTISTGTYTAMVPY